QARADGSGLRAGTVQALLPQRDPRSLQAANRCAPLLERGTNRVFAVRGGSLRQDAGTDSRPRDFRRAGLGRRLRDRGRQLRVGASRCGREDPMPSQNPSSRPSMLSIWAVLILSALASAPPALGQDRMPPVPPDKYDEAQKKAAQEFQTARKGPVFGSFSVLI